MDPPGICEGDGSVGDVQSERTVWAGVAGFKLGCVKNVVEQNQGLVRPRHARKKRVFVFVQPIVRVYRDTMIDVRGCLPLESGDNL